MIQSVDFGSTNWRKLGFISSSFIQIKLEAKDVLANTNRTQAAEMAEKCLFCLSLVTLTFDPDLQTRPIEGPNMSSV